jgi:hypothetical protein
MRTSTPHSDYRDAVTNCRAQGVTADRVLMNIDRPAPPELLNSRFVYVAVSRGH